MDFRKIIHMDMDAFFASVEQRDNPDLRGKPVAVGGAGPRGVVAAASYEARKYGVYSAMAGSTARRKCPELVFVPSRFAVYKEVSFQILEIFREYTELVEPLSLDEAYLDVSQNLVGIPSATIIARQIKEKIKAKTQLTASAGISINKFLAKVASGMNKPDGLTLIKPEEAEQFVEMLPITEFHGIGKVTAARMLQLGIRTGFDLKQVPEQELYKHFGRAGIHFFQIARAQDSRPVQPNRERKSLGAEKTYADDLEAAEEMLEKLKELAQVVGGHLDRLHLQGLTLTLKIKYQDFTQTTRSKTTTSPVRHHQDLFFLSRDLLYRPNLPGKPVRLLGLSVSNLSSVSFQGTPMQLAFPFL